MVDETALFRRISTRAFDVMPEPVRRLHDVKELNCLAGRCSARRGRNPFARFFALLLGLPPEAEDVPITVSIRREGTTEVWVRSIAGRRFQSTMREERSGSLSETIGPVRFTFDLRMDEAGFSLHVEGCRVFGIPLPRIFLPVVEAKETAAGNEVIFDIAASMPFVGLVVAYRGRLDIEPVREGERPGQPVMLFDGVCNFCNRGVDFFLRRDPYGRIRFAAMQSHRGLLFLEKYGLPTTDYKTFVVLDGDRLIQKSDAVLHLTGYLRWPWPMLRMFALVPRWLRDRIYDLFARNRYKLMGKREICRVPTQAERGRFLL